MLKEILSILVVIALVNAELPTITAVSPQLGPPGQGIYIDGTNFVEGQTFVIFGNISAQAAVYNPNSLNVAVPVGSPLEVYPVISTPAGKSNPSHIPVWVAYPAQPPTINFKPNATGGVNCYAYIDGTNFWSGKTRAFIGNLELDLPVIYSATELGVTIPSYLSQFNGKIVYITIQTPLGRSTSQNGYLIDTTLPEGGFCF